VLLPELAYRTFAVYIIIDGIFLMTQDAAMLQKARDLNCPCEDIRLGRLGYATASSSSHYEEAKI